MGGICPSNGGANVTWLMRFIGTALSSNARFPPAPLLRGGGPKTGGGCDLSEPFHNRNLFCPSYGGVAERSEAGVVPSIPLPK